MKRIIKTAAIILIAATVLSGVSCTDYGYSDTFFSMDTYIKVTVFGKSSKENIKTVRDIITKCEQNYSATLADSELSRLNTEGIIGNASDGLLDMLGCVGVMYERTYGAYDVTVLPLVRLWDFGGENRVPSDNEIDETLKTVGFENVHLDGKNVTLNNGVQIDLGSCAKGYASEMAAKMLRESGVEWAVLSLGGNVVTVGSKPNSVPFRIGIADPFHPDNTIGILEVGECAVVTSGTYQRYFISDGKTYHHILDARTGRPSESGLVSITVVADNGMWADVLSTSLFLLGLDGTEKYYNNYGGFEYIAVTDKGEIKISGGLIDKFIPNK